MAIAAADPGGAGTGIITVRLGVGDTWDETRNKVFSLGDDVTGLATFLGHIEAGWNAGVNTSGYTTLVPITGMRSAPVEAASNSVAVGLWLTFKQTSPLNSAKQLVRTFFIPCAKESKFRTGADGVNWTDTDLAAIVTYLQNHLATKLAANNALVIGGWTIDQTESGFGSEFEVFNGKPG